jgi:hypothetical protein
MGRKRHWWTVRATSAFVHPWGCNVYMICWCGWEFSVPATRQKIQCPQCKRIRYMEHILQDCHIAAPPDPDPIFAVPPPLREED